MRALIAAGAAAGWLALAGCSTASRYEYYDHSGKTVDKKIDEKADRIGRNFRGVLHRTQR
jgi:hypothetical protein